MTEPITRHVESLQVDGITALKGAFESAWADRMREDMMSAFWKAIQRPGGAVGRGPRRWYVEVHPEEIRGFVELATHPWVIGISEAVLGNDYEIVEIGFDVLFEGAKFQPWHRDFPSPEATYQQRQLTSLAFSLTGVDVTEDMGPFEIAVGTHYDDGRDWNDQMFPPPQAAFSQVRSTKATALGHFPRCARCSRPTAEPMLTAERSSGRGAKSTWCRAADHYRHQLGRRRFFGK